MLCNMKLSLAITALIVSGSAQDVTAKPFWNSSDSNTSSVCCFVIVETFKQFFAQHYSTSTYTRPVQVTSITELVTPYPNGTVTNYETNVYLTNATFYTTTRDGQNPLSFYDNIAPGPFRYQVGYNTGLFPATTIITAGVTVTTPTAFAIFTTAKVITAAAVTDHNGNAVCGTPFTTGVDTSITRTETEIIDNIEVHTTIIITETRISSSTVYPGLNSNAQAYYGANVDGIATGSFVATTFTDTDFQPSVQSLITKQTFYTNAAGQTINTGNRQAGVTLTFPTPYIYQPASGAGGQTGIYNFPCQFGADKEKLGYPPQSLLDYMVGIPAISSQYPGLESCIAGGPSILPATYCLFAAPVVQDAQGTDLTQTTVLTVVPRAQSIVQPTTTAVPALPTVEPLPSRTVPSPTVSATSVVPVPGPPLQNPPPAQNPPPTQDPPLAQDPSSDTSSPAANPLLLTSPSRAGISPVDSPTEPQSTDQSPLDSTQQVTFPTNSPLATPQPLLSLSAFQFSTTLSTSPNTFTTAAGALSPSSALILATTSGTASPPAVFSDNLLPDTTLPNTPSLLSQMSILLLNPTTITLSAAPALAGVGFTTTIKGTPYLVIESSTLVLLSPSHDAFTENENPVALPNTAPYPSSRTGSTDNVGPAGRLHETQNLSPSPSPPAAGQSANDAGRVEMGSGMGLMSVLGMSVGVVLGFVILL